MRLGPRKNDQEPQKKKYNGEHKKEMDCHEPHSAPNEKMQGIQWTKRPTSALVVASSLDVATLSPVFVRQGFT